MNMHLVEMMTSTSMTTSPMHTISTNQYHYHHQHHQQQYNLKNHLSNHSHHTSPFPILIQIYCYCQIMCFLCFLHEQKQNTVSINIYVCINNMPAIFCQFFAPICIYISSYFDAHSDTHTDTYDLNLRIVALLQRSKNDELPTILLKIKQSKCHTCKRFLLDHILKSIIFNKLHRDHAMYYQRTISFSISSAIFIHLKCVLLCIICINRMFVTILQIKSSYCYCLNVPLVIT